jgi:serine/threonine-protein kinase
LAPGAGDILALNLRDSTTVVVADSRFEESGPELSPDGRWIAFCSNRTGQKEIYVRPFPNVEDGLWQVSSEGGFEPRWRRDGSELYYWNHSEEMMAARVAFTPSFAVLGQSVLFRGPFYRNDDSHFFDVTADGRFLALRFDQPDSNARAEQDHGQPVLVQGWGTELRRLLAR